MVFLLLEPNHLQQTLSFAQSSGSEVWLGADAMSERRHKELCSSGHKITRFAYGLLGASSEVVEGALATIKEHHPAEAIWVQYVA